MTASHATIPPMRVCFPEEDIERIARDIAGALRAGALSGGPHVPAFEEAFARFVGAPEAVALSSGTAALETILRGLGLRGAEVLVPANTFIATASAVIHSGNEVRLVDIDPMTASPAQEHLSRVRTSRSRAVVLVHIGGLVTPQLPRIRDWCRHEGLLLIEDAAHAHGSTLGQEAAGTLGRAAAFSTFATKVLTTGEGGLVTTADGDLAQRIRVLRDHGKAATERNLHEVIGGNWRMSEVHAILGRAQVERVPAFLETRSRIAAQYDQALSGASGLTPLRPAGASSWYKYIVLLPRGVDKTGVRERMREQGVRLSGDVYDVPLHRQPVFQGRLGESFPGAEEFAARHVCLPIYVQMSAAEVDQVVTALTTALAAEGAGLR